MNMKEMYGGEKSMKKVKTKILALVLICVMIAGLIPATAFATGEGSVDVDSRVSDGSTSERWTKYFNGNTTEFAGGVWTDKSVYTNEQLVGETNVTLDDPNNFLVSLSTLASTMSITGQGRVPLDVMIILDLSSSMYRRNSQYDATLAVNQMVQAVNESITRLQNLNPENRVGVTIYDGGGDVMTQSTAEESGIVLLELGRYEKGTDDNNPYLKVNLSTRDGVKNSLDHISTAPGLKKINEENGQTISYSNETSQVPQVAGTYAQKGILDALEQFLAADTVTEDGIPRQPVFMFMSDGEPTAATEDFTNKNANATMGNNQVDARQPVQTDFVTQLTAAYAKAQVDIHYEEYSPLFYTLSLGSSISVDVMDPVKGDNATIKGYWDTLVKSNNSMTLVTRYYKSWDTYVAGKPDGTRNGTVVKATLLDGTKFPSSVEQRNYVDKAFTAADADNMPEVFQAIINDINLQSIFYPTLVQGDADFSGEITFIDNIGKYMTVKDIKGLLIGKNLLSGSLIAQSLDVTLPEKPEDYPALFQELYESVQQKLSINGSQAQALIEAAYAAKQIDYIDEDNYSHYIGWFAEEKNNQMRYKAPWNENMEIQVDDKGLVTSPANAAGAKYYIKSYLFAADINNDNFDSKNAMYTTVWVRTEIATGDETVIYSIPASMIPTVELQVALKEDGTIESLKSNAVDNPIELVYEVGLRSDINKYNIYEKVDAEYIEANTNQENGEILFYTNDFDRDKITTDDTTKGTVNTYSYFRPSKENPRYYYTADTPMFVKNGESSYVKYSGETLDTSKEYYREYVYYEKAADGTLSTIREYRKISDVTIGHAVQKEGTWYIPKGDVHLNLEGYYVPKVGSTDDKPQEGNLTDTLQYSNIPFVSQTSSTNPTEEFIIGATLGNNGRIGMVPDTGIKVTKQLEAGTQATDEEFSFILSGGTANDSIRIVTVNVAGEEIEGTGAFNTNGEYQFTLKAGEAVYLLGLKAGDYTLTEEETADYKLVSMGTQTSNNYGFTVTENMVQTIDVTNAVRGKGNLAISKQINAPDTATNVLSRTFKIDIDFDGIGTANQTFDAVFSNADNTTAIVTGSVKTDENGKIISVIKGDVPLQELVIGNAESININGLPDGTTATVTEILNETDTNFKTTYNVPSGTIGTVNENNVKVNIVKNTTAQVDILNTWVPKELTSQLNLDIVKYLVENSDGSAAVWPKDISFEFVLQYYESGNWVDLGKCTVDGKNEDKTASFMGLGTSGETTNQPVVFTFKEEGTYDFQIYEVPGAFENVNTDTTYYVFRVVVETNTDGQLYVKQAELVEDEQTLEGLALGDELYSISVSDNNVNGEFKFTNLYFDELDRPVVITLDIYKQLLDYSGANMAPSGFRFGIYTDEQCTETLREAIAKMSPQDNGKTEVEILQSVATTAQDGIAWVNLQFNNIGEYTYYVKEIIPTTPKSGMTYSTKVLKVYLNIGRRQESSAAELLEWSVTEVSNPESEVDVSVAETAEGNHNYEFKIGSNQKVFVNEYTPTSTSVELQAIKTMVDDNNKSLELKAGLFKFKVTKDTVNGELIGEYTNNVSVLDNTTGKYSAQIGTLKDSGFEAIQLELQTIGTHVFVIQEISNASENQRITYDKTPHTLSVEVADNNGQLYVKTTTMSGTASGSLVADFENVKHPDEISYQITGTKTLNNRDMEAAMFFFDLNEANADGTLKANGKVMTTSNDANGRFTFDLLTFSEAGTYYYVVTEQDKSSTLPKYTFDPVNYLITIVVKEDANNGEKLYLETPTFEKLKVDGQKEKANAIEFNNTYTPASVALNLKGTKYMYRLNELEEKEYTFELYQTGSDYNVSSGAELLQTVTTKVQGESGASIVFKTITYTLESLDEDKAKSFYYVVKEKVPETNPENGILYDTSVYEIKVDVSYNSATGVLTMAGPVITEKDSTTSTGSIVFRNSIIEPAKLTLGGGKKLDGRDLKNGEFTFNLVETDASGNPIKNGKKLTATNTLDEKVGKFTFAEITYQYDDIGFHYYKITEDASAALSGVVYDDTEYIVEVEVKDIGVGLLSASITKVNDNPLENDGDGKPINPIVFENSYEGGPRLPDTGGIGIFLYISSGWALVAIASVLMYKSKRKQWKGAR